MRTEIQAHCEKHGIDYPYSFDPYNYDSERIGSCPECDKERRGKEIIERFVAMVEESNVSLEHRQATVENFITKNNAMEKAKDAVKKLIGAKTGKLLFLGNHGTGKTHLASAAVLSLWGQIWSMYEISCMIRESYTARAKESELDIVKKLSAVPMLAIDEIGRTKGSEAELNWLSYIIDKRHTRGLPMILISNKHRRSACPVGSGCSDCIEQFLPTDAISRLLQGGEAIDFTWEDYRGGRA